MNFELNEIITLIDKVKDTNLDTFEYQDNDVRLKIKGKRTTNAINNSEITTEAPARIPVNKEKQQEIATSPKKEAAQPVDETPVSTLPENSLYIEAPLVGTFYHAPAEGAEPFVTVGTLVKKGQTIGIIEAMKLMNEIQSEVEGTVEEILVPNETLVEFGQKLIRIRPL